MAHETRLFRYLLLAGLFTHSAAPAWAQRSRPAVTPRAFPVLSVAASGRGTVVRIDVNTGAILGEYLSAPAGMGRDPSRTTVDFNGNTWVANRAEAGAVDGKPHGSITRIGLVLGGTRVNAQGAPDTAGRYVRGPYRHNTCVDRNNDRLIATSAGLGDTLGWKNPDNVDLNGGVSSSEDECITAYVRVPGPGTRTVAVTSDNDVWVGGTGNRTHVLVRGQSATIVPDTEFNLGCGGYGGVVDGAGVLWSAREGGLLRYDTHSKSGQCLSIQGGDYGVAVDPATGDVWYSRHTGGVVARIAPDGSVRGTHQHGSSHAQGLAVDRSGNVWVAHSVYGATVGHLLTDGSHVGNVELPEGKGPTGVAVDLNGKVWVTNHGSDNVMRIDPLAGPRGAGGVPVGAVDLVVSLGPGARPYNYSDMTGQAARLVHQPVAVVPGTLTVRGAALYEASMLELVLDMSGSMWGRVAGGLKIDLAKNAIIRSIDSLPEQLRVGLRLYGHRIRAGRPGACEDSELVIRPAPLQKAELKRYIRGLRPVGTTPIAFSLRQVAEDVKDETGTKAVILVTDGEEECGGDLQGMLKRLSTELALQVTLVGFAIRDAAARKAFDELAEEAGTRYIDARDAAGLRSALRTALAARVEVLDQGGTTVLKSVPVGEAVELPPGVYSLVVRRASGEVRISGVAIRPGHVTDVSLDDNDGAVRPTVASRPQTGNRPGRP